MCSQTIELTCLDDLDVAAKAFIAQMNGSVVAFYGEMGAGKTTFIKAICRQLGVDDVITSPTFSIVNEYTAGNGAPVFHFDFYRIKKVDEVFDMGYEDYFYSGSICFIEWPELIEGLLPDDTMRVKILRKADNIRTISF